MTLNCNGKILDLHTKKIMGIINLSQDSFYDGGKYDSIDKVNAQISNLVSNGAEIIDIGAASSKPGSKLIDPKKELDIVSDYIIELGPGGGKNGGSITFEGYLRDIFKNKIGIHFENIPDQFL